MGDGSLDGTPRPSCPSRSGQARCRLARETNSDWEDASPVKRRSGARAPETRPHIGPRPGRSRRLAGLPARRQAGNRSVRPRPAGHRRAGGPRQSSSILISLSSQTSPFHNFHPNATPKSRSPFSASCSFLRRLLPDPVDWHAQQDEDQARPGILRLVAEQLDFDEQRHHDIDNGQHRVAPGFIGADHPGPGPAQHEYPADGQDVEQQDREDQEVQQLPVSAGQAQYRRPGALHQQGRRGRETPVQRPHAREEHAVPRHGVVDARPGEDQSVVAAECGDHDCEGHEYPAAMAEGDLGHGGRDAILRGELDAAVQHGGPLGGSPGGAARQGGAGWPGKRGEKPTPPPTPGGGGGPGGVFSPPPATNVTLFHASAAKSEPTMATPITVSRPSQSSPPTPVPGPGWAGSKKCPKLAVSAVSVAKATPSTITPTSAPVLVSVRTFCTTAPVRIPRRFTHVRTMMERIAKRFWVFSPTV